MITIDYKGEEFIVLGITSNDQLLITDKSKSARFPLYDDYVDAFIGKCDVNYNILGEMDYSLAAAYLTEIDGTTGGYYIPHYYSMESYREDDSDIKTVGIFCTFGGGYFLMGLSQNEKNQFGRAFYIIDYEGDMEEMRRKVQEETQKYKGGKIDLIKLAWEAAV